MKSSPYCTRDLFQQEKVKKKQKNACNRRGGIFASKISCHWNLPFILKYMAAEMIIGISNDSIMTALFMWWVFTMTFVRIKYLEIEAMQKSKLFSKIWFTLLLWPISSRLHLIEIHHRLIKVQQETSLKDRTGHSCCATVKGLIQRSPCQDRKVCE